MFEFFKGEKKAKADALKALENELVEFENDLREKYSSQKNKNILRKINAVDKLFNKKQDEKIKKEVYQYRLSRMNEISRFYSERRKEYINQHKFKYIIAPICLLCVIIGLGAVGVSIDNKEKEEKYSLAVEYVADGKYSSAIKELKGLDYEDSEAVVKYCEINNTLNSYNGNLNYLIRDLKAVKTRNRKVTSLRDKNIGVLNRIQTLQNKINEIDLLDISADEENVLRKLDTKKDKIPDRYKSFLNCEKLDKANNALDEMKKGSAIGIVIAAISEIKDVRIESEAAISDIKSKYDSLSNTEKNKVVNYKKLEQAERKISALKEEVSKREESAKKQEVKNANESTVISPSEGVDNTQKNSYSATSGSHNSNSDFTPSGKNPSDQVYLSETGMKYHTNHCRTVKNGYTPITRGEAEAKGYDACGVCNP